MATWVDLDDDGVVYCGNRGEYENYNIPPEMVEHPVDAVPVIRCKYCAHNNLPPTAGNALCSINYGMTDVYGFCHRGERREE